MNAVTKKDEYTGVPMTQTEQTNMGGELLNSDILIPRIFLMQALSDLVQAEDSKVKPGDIVKSTTGEKLGDSKHPVWVMPLMIKNEWINQERIGGKFEWRGTEPRTAKNDDEPWEYTKNGTAWKRTKVINLFCLLPAEIEAFNEEMKKETPDINAIVTPCVVPFRSTSFTTGGKPVATFLAKARAMLEFNPNTRPYHYALPVTCYADENDKGKFFVFDTQGKPKPVQKEFWKEGERWTKILSTMADIKIDGSGVDNETAPTENARY